MRNKSIAYLLVAVVLISACESLEERPGETLGTLVGAAAGAILGSRVGGGDGQVIAGAVGAAAGAWFGSSIGKKLDEQDQQLAEATTQDTLENGVTHTTSSWSNPDSGNAGSIKPTSDRIASEDGECRDFESTVEVDDETEVATGRACRQPDGSWLIVQ